MITSGACRSAARSATAKPCESLCISRWETMQPLWLCRYSIGSSSVMMCPCRSRLMRSMRQASVVLLPLPAGPVTSTMPLCVSARSITLCGMPRRCGSGSSKRTTRSTAASEPRCMYAQQRKRPTPGREKEKSSSPCVSSRSMGRPFVSA